ncbi:MAG: DUF4166 domain-containing protein [Rhodobacteraceae bacterium]|nr:DUF4166 domain-containing protein [Paracoccaceae bacterium]
MEDPFLRALVSKAELPRAVTELHSHSGHYCGLCEIERGRGPFVWMLLWLGRFQRAGEDVPVSLDVRHDGQVWTWHRNFGGHVTASILSHDPQHNCVVERMGALKMCLKPVFQGGQIHVSLTRLTVFGLRCPRGFLPVSETTESEDAQKRYHFDVAARLPVLGLLIRYRGWLRPRAVTATKEQ